MAHPVAGEHDSAAQDSDDINFNMPSSDSDTMKNSSGSLQPERCSKDHSQINDDDEMDVDNNTEGGELNNKVVPKRCCFPPYHFTQEDREEIEKLSKDPRIVERIIKSIAPSVRGHKDMKTAIALALFGGQERNVEEGRVRGDVNILVLGDPGTMKSKFLTYVETTGLRGTVYTTGKGASGVGLTAAVHKDPITQDWILKEGPLVQADRGICLIDEFEKMNDHDRIRIHEAMEKQSINISKAGLVASLPARCSIIAAANPIEGRYDSSKIFSQNVELTAPILSQFDILCVAEDVVDPAPVFTNIDDDKSINSSKEDELEASAILTDPDILAPDVLNKYVTYAKSHVFPRWPGEGLDQYEKRKIGVKPMSVKHFQSIIRISEAYARMHLRQHVTVEDDLMAHRVLIESVVSSQTHDVKKQLQLELMHVKEDFEGIILYKLDRIVKNILERKKRCWGKRKYTDVTLEVEKFKKKLRFYGIKDLKPFFSGPQLSRSNYRLDEELGLITYYRQGA